MDNYQFNNPFFVTYFTNLTFTGILAAKAVVKRSKLFDPIGPKQYLKWAAIFGPMWFLMNFFVAKSLNLTTVSSNSSLSTLSAGFTIIFAYLITKKKANFWQILGVIGVFGGSILIGIPDAEMESNGSETGSNLIGDLWEFGSALLYGLFTILVELKVNQSDVVLLDLFGSFSLFNLVSLLPVVLILHFKKVEDLSTINGPLLGLLFLGGSLSVLSDYVLGYTSALASPLFANVGLSLTIPVSIFIDMLVLHTAFNYIYLIGAAVMFLGFVATNIEPKKKALIISVPPTEHNSETDDLLLLDPHTD
jgi:solute carrier family 35 protein F5